MAERLSDISKEQSAISRKGTHIVKDYLKRLGTAVQILNVTNIELDDLKKFKACFTSGGNDLPCAILAQVWEYVLLLALFHINDKEYF